MKKPTIAPRKHSILKGALAGLIGGVVGSAAKIVAEKIYPPRLPGQTTPPALLAENLVQHPLTPSQKSAAKQQIHWAFGAMAGAAYGAAVEIEPRTAAWQGAAFGLVLKRMTHDTLLPKLNLDSPPEKQSVQARQSEWISHVVFGVTVELARKIARRQLR